MRTYHLEEMYDGDFENLSNAICSKVLGVGVISFAPGKDGGKDGRFSGKANNFPSNDDSWEGNFIIQSKHTSNPMASMSDSDFSGIVNKEIEALKKINDIDCYILFTNRKHTGIKGDSLIHLIKNETKIKNVEIIGKETIFGYLRDNPEIVRIFDLENLKDPLRINSEDIIEVIEAFKNEKENIDMIQIKKNIKPFNLESKNSANNLSQIYYKNLILKKSQLEFDTIKDFLGNPKHNDFLEAYNDISEELQGVLLTFPDKFEEFSEVFEYYYKHVLDKYPKMKNKRLVRVFLHYMYCNCDIGVSAND